MYGFISAVTANYPRLPKIKRKPALSLVIKHGGKTDKAKLSF